MSGFSKPALARLGRELAANIAWAQAHPEAVSAARAAAKAQRRPLALDGPLVPVPALGPDAARVQKAGPVDEPRDDHGRWADGGTSSAPVPRTPQFKAWFGESKIVDAQGDPVVLYHGTNARFSSFDLQKTTQGVIWATSDRSKIERGEAGAQGAGHIMALYASIKHPAGWAEYDQKSLGELQRDGYDGVVLPDPDGTFDVIAFAPAQFKSATKNRTFDPRSRNIYKADFDESQHPRDEHGRWTDGGGGDSSATAIIDGLVSRFGTVKTPGQTRFLLPDGRRLGFSGAHEAALGGRAALSAALSAGAIRYVPHVGVEVGAMPTDMQLETMAADWEGWGDSLVVDVRDGSGDLASSKEFFTPEVRVLGRWIREQLVAQGTARKAGPPDEPRDEHGRWTDGSVGGVRAPRVLPPLKGQHPVLEKNKTWPAPVEDAVAQDRYGKWRARADMGYSDAERSAIDAYMRSTTPGGREVLNAAMEKSPFLSDAIVWRAVPDLTDLDPSWMTEGAVVTKGSFVATSERLSGVGAYLGRRGDENSCLFRIHVPEGMPALNISASLEGESEILLPSYAHFRVDKVGKGQGLENGGNPTVRGYLIDLTVLPPLSREQKAGPVDEPRDAHGRWTDGNAPADGATADAVGHWGQGPLTTEGRQVNHLRISVGGTGFSTQDVGAVAFAVSAIPESIAQRLADDHWGYVLVNGVKDFVAGGTHYRTAGECYYESSELYIYDQTSDPARTVWHETGHAVARVIGAAVAAEVAQAPRRQGPLESAWVGLHDAVVAEGGTTPYAHAWALDAKDRPMDESVRQFPGPAAGTGIAMRHAANEQFAELFMGTLQERGAGRDADAWLTGLATQYPKTIAAYRALMQTVSHTLVAAKALREAAVAAEVRLVTSPAGAQRLWVTADGTVTRVVTYTAGVRAQKYSPDQPRIEAGDPRGGQFAPKDGVGELVATAHGPAQVAPPVAPDVAWLQSAGTMLVGGVPVRYAPNGSSHDIAAAVAAAMKDFPPGAQSLLQHEGWHVEVHPAAESAAEAGFAGGKVQAGGFTDEDAHRICVYEDNIPGATWTIMHESGHLVAVTLASKMLLAQAGVVGTPAEGAALATTWGAFMDAVGKEGTWSDYVGKRYFSGPMVDLHDVWALEHAGGRSWDPQALATTGAPVAMWPRPVNEQFAELAAFATLKTPAALDRLAEKFPQSVASFRTLWAAAQAPIPLPKDFALARALYHPMGMQAFSAAMKDQHYTVPAGWHAVTHKAEAPLAIAVPVALDGVPHVETIFVDAVSGRVRGTTLVPAATALFGPVPDDTQYLRAQSAIKSGPADEPRDEHGRWTDGGGDVLASVREDLTGNLLDDVNHLGESPAIVRALLAAHGVVAAPIARQSFDATGAEHRVRDLYVTPEGGVIRFDGEESYPSTWDSVAEFVTNELDPSVYYPGRDVQFSADFWDSPPPLYHATSAENAAAILAGEGLAPRDATRGIGNRGTGAAVFATTNLDAASDGAYGDTVLAIDTAGMRRDGVTPFVSEEGPVVEYDLRFALAHALGDDQYGSDLESGISPDTIVMHGAVPAKYLHVVGSAAKAGPPGEPRDDHGRWTDGGGGAPAKTATDFATWFHGSVVTDAQGRPRVMVHGTNAGPIDRFRPGTHFGTVAAARERMDILRTFSTDVVGRDPGTFHAIEVYLDIKHPLRVPDLATLDEQTGEPLDEALAAFHQRTPEDQARREAAGEDPSPRTWESEQALSTTLLEQGVIDIDQYEAVGRDDRKLYAILRAKGYDGLVYRNAVEDAGQDSYVIFDPAQVWRVAAARKFDPNEPRDERGRWTDDGGAADAVTEVGITSGQPGYQDPIDIGDDLAHYASYLRSIGVHVAAVGLGDGGWVDATGTVHMEPTWLLSYHGNGHALAALKQAGKLYHQQAVLVRTSTTWDDPAAEPHAVLRFGSAMSAAAWAHVGRLARDVGLGGWTVDHGTQTLSATAVPAWGGDATTHVAQVTQLAAQARAAGYPVTLSLHARTVAVLSPPYD